MTKDGDVQITKRDTGTVQCVLTGHKSLVRAVDEQIDGNGRLLIATGDWDGQACVWDGESGEQVTEFHAGPLRIRSIALTALPGGRILVAACSDSQIEIWDETNESRPIRLPLMIHPAISAVAWGLLPAWTGPARRRRRPGRRPAGRRRESGRGTGGRLGVRGRGDGTGGRAGHVRRRGR